MMRRTPTKGSVIRSRVLVRQKTSDRLVREKSIELLVPDEEARTRIRRATIDRVPLTGLPPPKDFGVSLESSHSSPGGLVAASEKRAATSAEPSPPGAAGSSGGEEDESAAASRLAEEKKEKRGSRVEEHTEAVASESPALAEECPAEEAQAPPALLLSTLSQSLCEPELDGAEELPESESYAEVDAGDDAVEEFEVDGEEEEMQKMARAKPVSSMLDEVEFAPCPTIAVSPQLLRANTAKGGLKFQVERIQDRKPLAQLAPVQQSPMADEEVAEEVVERSKRWYAAQELYETEVAYVQRTTELLEWLEAMTAIVASQGLDAPLIGMAAKYLKGSVPMNTQLLRMMQNRMGQTSQIELWNDETSCIGDVFLMIMPLFKTYAPYVTIMDEIYPAMEKCVEENEAFAAYFREARSKGSIHQRLASPAKRGPQYIMTLQEILKRTAPEHPDFQNLSDAISLVNSVTLYMDCDRSQQETLERFSSFAAQFEDGRALILPHRKLLLDGQLVTRDTQEKINLWLCTDMLIVLTQEELEKKKSIATAQNAWPLEIVWATLHSSMGSNQVGSYLSLIGPHRELGLVGVSPEATRSWHEKIVDACQKHLKTHSMAHIDAGDVATRRSSVHEVPFPSGIETVPFLERNIMYHGEWLLGSMDGRGTWSFFNNHYEGEFDRNVRRGHGAFTAINGDKYIGEFAANTANGEGAVHFRSGDVFEGVWANGVPNGKGVFRCATGMTVEGEWLNGEMHGPCRVVMPCGSVCSGKWDNGWLDGSVEMEGVAGFSYKGSVERGLYHGFGLLSTPVGTYTGHFKSGERDGQGKYESRGVRYEGLWKGGRQHGRGQMALLNEGRVIDGTFKAGQIHGKAEVTFPGVRSAWGSAMLNYEHGNVHGKAKIEYSPLQFDTSSTPAPPPLEITVKCSFKDNAPHGGMNVAIRKGKALIEHECHWKHGAPDPDEYKPIPVVNEEDVVESMLQMSKRSFGAPLDIFDFAAFT